MEHSHGRRRSVDTGGLSLALKNQGAGSGWGGWDEHENGETSYAESLSDMYTNVLLTVNENISLSPPMELTNPIRARLIDALDSWNFEPHKLAEEEVLSCTLILFETLFRIEGMEEDAGVSLAQMQGFLDHLRSIYRCKNSYHNYQHALDVLQATHTFLWSAGVVPSVSILLEHDRIPGEWPRPRTWSRDGRQTRAACLTNRDLFAIYIAAIGHDVGHPGFTNVFMKNAKTPLSVVYDDKSALEHMHYALLLQVMRQHGLGGLLDAPNGEGQHFRKLLLESVLATDMRVHYDFMARFKAEVEQSPAETESSFTKCARTVLICQAVIKCADISNPSRPHQVSQYWAAALMEEWTSQASLEKHFHLPATVQPSDNPLSEARSQVWFINTFAKPLLDLVSQGIPEMQAYADQCASNLRLWEDRVAVLEQQSASSSPAPTAPRLPEDFMTAFPMTLPPSFLTPNEESLQPTWYPSSETQSSASSDDSDNNSQYEPSHTIPVHSPPTTSSSSVASPPQSFKTSPPSSPSGTDTSFLLSPRSEFSTPSHDFSPAHSRCGSTTSRPPSSVGSVNSDATVAMRAAYQLSVRKKKSMNRNSWNAPTMLYSLSAPPIPHPPSTAPHTAPLPASLTRREVPTEPTQKEGVVIV